MITIPNLDPTFALVFVPIQPYLVTGSNERGFLIMCTTGFFGAFLDLGLRVTKVIYWAK